MEKRSKKEEEKEKRIQSERGRGGGEGGRVEDIVMNQLIYSATPTMQRSLTQRRTTK